MTDKRITEEDVVARAARRHDDRHRRLGLAPQADEHRARASRAPTLQDLTIVSYGGPDVGLLCATGKVKKVVYAFCSLDSIALEPHFRKARQAGTVRRSSSTRACSCSGCRPAAWRVPFLPDAGRARLRRRRPPARDPHRASRPTTTARSWWPRRRSNLDVALVHMHRGDARGNGQYLNVDPYFDDLVLHGRAARVHERRAGRAHRRARVERAGADAARSTG